MLYAFFVCHLLQILKYSTESQTDYHPCHSEYEPEVQSLLVSDVTTDSFQLSWMAEEDSFDTFVIMVSQAKGLDQPRELVLGGEERSAVMTDLNEDTEYKAEIFGLILERRSKSLLEVLKTGTQWKDGTRGPSCELELWIRLVRVVNVEWCHILSLVVTAWVVAVL